MPRATKLYRPPRPIVLVLYISIMLFPRLAPSVLAILATVSADGNKHANNKPVFKKVQVLCPGLKTEDNGCTRCKPTPLYCLSETPRHPRLRRHRRRHDGSILLPRGQDRMRLHPEMPRQSHDLCKLHLGLSQHDRHCQRSPHLRHLLQLQPAQQCHRRVRAKRFAERQHTGAGGQSANGLHGPAGIHRCQWDRSRRQGLLRVRLFFIGRMCADARRPVWQLSNGNVQC